MLLTGSGMKKYLFTDARDTRAAADSMASRSYEAVRGNQQHRARKSTYTDTRGELQQRLQGFDLRVERANGTG